MTTTPLVLVLLVFTQIIGTESACTMPEIFRNTQWLENAKGSVNFTTWKMTGWTVRVGGDVLDDWETVDNVRFDDDGYIAMRSIQTFTKNQTTYFGYVCFKFEKLTNDIYKYYTLHDQEPLADNNNVLVETHDDLTRFEQICKPNYNLDKKLFSVLVRAGKTPSMTCPNPILANFKYEVTLPDGSVACTPQQTGWTGCSNIRKVELLNTSCNYPVAFSDSGRLNCISSYKDGDVTSVILMNTDDTVDDVSTFRFACAMVKDDGTEMVISPQECYPSQTTSQFPRNRAGVVVGQRIIASNVETNCRIDTNGDGDDGGLSTPAIIGIVLGAIALIVIIIGIICCCLKCRN